MKFLDNDGNEYTLPDCVTPPELEPLVNALDSTFEKIDQVYEALEARIKALEDKCKVYDSLERMRWTPLKKSY